MSTDRFGKTPLGLVFLQQALQRTQQFLRRTRRVCDVQFHGGQLFQVLNIGAATPAFKQNRGLVARLIMQFLYELHDQRDSGAIQRAQSGQVADLVGDPRIMD